MIRALAISALLLVSSAHAVDVDRAVDALRVREGYRGQRGALGEEGPWQFMPSTWAMHMPGRPFAEARNHALARACAVKHVRWLATQLEARGVDASVFNIAAAWNAGLERYLSGRAPVRAYHFAADVVAIYSKSGVARVGARLKHRFGEDAIGNQPVHERARLVVGQIEFKGIVQAPARWPLRRDRPHALRPSIDRHEAHAGFLSDDRARVTAQPVAHAIDREYRRDGVVGGAPAHHVSFLAFVHGANVAAT